MSVLNPELRRNFWLEISTQRLILTPVVVLIFVLIFESFDAPSADRLFAGLAFSAFVLAVLHGAWKSYASVSEEIRDRTWDLQRMSSLSPWTLVLGKLFGATSFSWYSAAIFLLITIVYQRTAHPSALLLMLSVISALLLFSFALVMALSAAERLRRTPERRGGVIWAIVVCMMVGSIASSWVPVLLRTSRLVPWWGLEINPLWFCLGSGLFFLFWAVGGAYRLMRLELLLRNLPWFWVAFLLSQSFYWGGFRAESHEWLRVGRLAILLGVFTAYGLVSRQVKNVVAFRMFAQAWSRRDWANVFCLCPTWLVSVVYALIFAMATLSAEILRFGLSHQTAVLTSLALFCLRDVLVVVFCNLAVSARRADLTALFYLFIAYVVLPGVIAALRLKHLLFLFYPAPAGDIWQIVTPGLIQTAVLVALVRRRWVSVVAPS